MRPSPTLGSKPPDIDAILPYVLGPTSDEMASQLGISDLRYSSIIKMGGATFVACLETAALLIHNNIARNVLVFCSRNGRSGTRVTGRVSTIPGQRLPPRLRSLRTATACRASGTP